MKGLPEERAVLLGRYIAENGATVRKAAKVFQISKSPVHKNNALYLQVKQVLEQNKQERHIRGGMATREKYEKLKQDNTRDFEHGIE